jgi:hypothetical protein
MLDALLWQQLWCVLFGCGVCSCQSCGVCFAAASYALGGNNTPPLHLLHALVGRHDMSSLQCSVSCCNTVTYVLATTISLLLLDDQDQDLACNVAATASTCNVLQHSA